MRQWSVGVKVLGVTNDSRESTYQPIGSPGGGSVAGGGRFLVFSSVTDNSSNDSTVVQPQW